MVEGFLLMLVLLVSALNGLPVKEVICDEAPAYDPEGFSQVVQEGDASPPTESADR